MSARRKDREQTDSTEIDHKIKHKNDEILQKKLQNQTMHKMSKIRSLNICLQKQAMLRTLCARTSIREILSSEKNVKMTMRTLQKNSQNI